MQNRHKSLASALFLAAMICQGVTAQEDMSSSKKADIDKRYQSEIKSLSQQPVIKSAFQAIMDIEPETMKDLITLTEIPAPPYKEQKRAQRFMQMVKDAGIDSIWMDKAGNVIGLRRGQSGAKTVVLEAHLDTVFPEGTDVTVKQKGETLPAQATVEAPSGGAAA